MIREIASWLTVRPCTGTDPFTGPTLSPRASACKRPAIWRGVCERPRSASTLDRSTGSAATLPGWGRARRRCARQSAVTILYPRVVVVLRRTSRETTDAHRSMCAAIARIDQPALSPVAISTRSATVNILRTHNPPPDQHRCHDAMTPPGRGPEPRTAPPGHPPGQGQTRAARRRPLAGVDLGHHQAARAGQGDLLPAVRADRHLLPVQPLLDHLPGRGLPAGHRLHRRGHRAQRRRPAHRARRPRHLDDLPTRLGAAGRPGCDPLPLPAPGQQRQPVLRGTVQDPEVPARVPVLVRLPGPRPPVLRRLLPRVQLHPPSSRDRVAHPGLGPLRHRPRDRPRPAEHPDRRLPRPPRAIRSPTTPTGHGDPVLDQPARPRTPKQLTTTVSFDLTDTGSRPLTVSIWWCRPGRAAFIWPGVSGPARSWGRARSAAASSASPW